MSGLFVDSSVVIAIGFGEAGAAGAADLFWAAERVRASPLMEAELRAACTREGRSPDDVVLARIEWIHADRRLSPEIARVLAAGYSSGADCWHLATALFVAPRPREMTFLTLDTRQRVVAKKLGFRV